MTWTHNGAPLGPKPRPWRLTRRQRVEMEAALARLRYDVCAPPTRAPVPDAVIRGARAMGRTTAAELYVMRVRNSGTQHDWRILRARVAIALRAALRADEDARCEATDDLRDTVGSDVDDVLDRVREWPALRPITAMQWVESGDVGEHLADHRAHGFIAWAEEEDGGGATVHSRLPAPLALWERAR